MDGEIVANSPQGRVSVKFPFVSMRPYTARGGDRNIRVLTPVWPGFSETRIFVKVSSHTVDRRVIGKSYDIRVSEKPGYTSATARPDLRRSSPH